MYEKVLEAVGQADTGKEVLATAEGRETLATLVDHMAATEALAADEMAAALAAMR